MTVGEAHISTELTSARSKLHTHQETQIERFQKVIPAVTVLFHTPGN